MKVEIKIIGAEHMQPEDVADLMSAVSEAVDSKLGDIPFGDPKEEGKSWIEMPYKEREQAYNKIIGHFGIITQRYKAIEEMSELTNALAKLCQDGFKHEYDEAPADILDNLIEEIADVTIMMEQLRLIFDCNEEVKQIMADKIDRTLERMEKK